MNQIFFGKNSISTKPGLYFKGENQVLIKDQKV